MKILCHFNSLLEDIVKNLAAVIRIDDTYDIIIRRDHVLSDALKQVGRLSFDPMKKMLVSSVS